MRPDLISKINKIVILGGVVGEAGNISEYAEFNVFNDPLALHHVLGFEGVEKVLIPIDVCRNVMFGLSDFDRIPEKFEDTIKQITKNYINYYATDSQFGGFSGGVMYDLLAVDYVLHPELFSSKQVYIEVNYSDQANRGETKLIKNSSPNCTLVTAVEAKDIKKMFIKSFE